MPGEAGEAGVRVLWRGVRWGAVAEVMREAVGEAVGDREGSATSSFLAAP